MNRNALNLGLAVLVAALAGGAWLAQKQKKEEETKPPLTALGAEGLSSASVAWPDAPEIRLLKEGDQWRLTAPVSARVDRFEALNFGNLATTEIKDSLSNEGLDLKALGLDPPERVITLNDQRIELGATDPIEFRRYARIGERVVLIDDPVSAAFDRDYHDLVSKELFATGEEIVSLELPGLSLRQGADGQWQAQPASAQATPEAIAQLIAAWKGASAMWNEAGDGALDGERLRIGLKGGEVREFILAAREPQLSLYSPTVRVRFQLSKALETELLQLPAPKPATSESVPGAGAGAGADN